MEEHRAAAVGLRVGAQGSCHRAEPEGGAHHLPSLTREI